MQHFEIQPGDSYPPGASVRTSGTNFCIFSRHATCVELLLYETADCETPFQVITLNPDVHRTFFFWHVFVVGLREGVHYTWRADGPVNTPEFGVRFNTNKELLDPWARAMTASRWDRRRASIPEDTGSTAMRARTVDTRKYDWQGDVPLNHALEDTIIYELHVGGFTRHASANVRHPGTFLGLIEKIDYLKSLGITDVELMPVMAFDEQDVPPGAAQRGLRNYWGYSTHSFFCPHPGYCVAPERGEHHREFRDMVKALHSANIGVILDVVYNHTAEGGEGGPWINFKGLINEIFYHLDPADRRRYIDYTGCGNTVNCNHPLVTRFIINSLAYWVKTMHVDGFRFDLASVFARGENGEPMYNAPVPWSIEFSQTLARTRIIAEAWDAAGLYQVGSFPGYRWSEWNGRYRDVVRRYVRGDRGMIAEVATAMTGSSDLYGPQGRLPINSINFVTCHDGFTMYDLVSYNHKHNEANGEDNRDGHNENFSWNCGVEGPTDDPEVLALRRRQAKNFFAILLLSQGVPMICAGDEVLRTQHGNNNAYCQDNDIGWFDWRLVDEHRDMLRFVRMMVAFRKRHRCLRRKRFLTGKVQEGRPLPDITWYDKQLYDPVWDDPVAQLIQFTLCGFAGDDPHVHVVLNMSDGGVSVRLPELERRRWFLAIDTSHHSPEDIFEPEYQPRVHDGRYGVSPRSIVVLEGR